MKASSSNSGQPVYPNLGGSNPSASPGGNILSHGPPQPQFQTQSQSLAGPVRPVPPAAASHLHHRGPIGRGPMPGPVLVSALPEAAGEEECKRVAKRDMITGFLCIFVGIITLNLWDIIAGICETIGSSGIVCGCFGGTAGSGPRVWRGATILAIVFNVMAFISNIYLLSVDVDNEPAVGLVVFGLIFDIFMIPYRLVLLRLITKFIELMTPSFGSHGIGPGAPPRVVVVPQPMPSQQPTGPVVHGVPVNQGNINQPMFVQSQQPQLHPQAQQPVAHSPFPDSGIQLQPINVAPPSPQPPVIISQERLSEPPPPSTNVPTNFPKV